MHNSSSSLTVEQQKLLQQLMESEGLSVQGSRSIPRHKLQHPPLSYAQQRMWFLQQFETNPAGLFNVPSVIWLDGALDPVVLAKAITAIVERHEALRTIVAEINGSMTQVVNPVSDVRVRIVDLQESETKTEAAQRENAVRIIEEEIRTPFDLKRSPLLRVLLVRITPAKQALVINAHHIASDGWSLSLFAQELTELYKAFCNGQTSPLPELSIQYSDYSVWQREWLQGEIQDQQLRYWKKQLAGLSDLDLPMTYSRPAARSHRGESCKFFLPQSLIQQLEVLDQPGGSSLFMKLLAAFQILLYRYSGQSDVAVATPIAGRNRTETEALIGLFVNTLIMRADLSGNPDFMEVLKRVRQVALDAYSNQDVPFEVLVEQMQTDRHADRVPFTQVMFVLQNTPPVAWNFAGIEGNEEVIHRGSEAFDLLLEFKIAEGGLRGEIGFRTDVFDMATAERMAGHFQTLLASIADGPETAINELELLTAEEKSEFELWNQTTAEYAPTCLHKLFEQQAQRTAERTAVIHEDEEVSYAELDRRATRVARLLQAKGVGPEVRVGICMDRSVNMVVALLATLKAGGAYVPLDPEYPAERVNFMLEDSHASIVLSISSLKQRLSHSRAEIICMDALDDYSSYSNREMNQLAVVPENAAYVIYTSGSTGKPKGTVIEHRSATMLLYWAWNFFSHEELAGVLASTSICFDLSVFELFVPLSRGGTVVLSKNALQLPNLKAAEKVTLVNTVPSAATELLRMKALGPRILTVNLAGEPLKRKLSEEIYQAGVSRVINLYGPTEDTTYSTVAVLERGDTRDVPIGRPVSRTQLHVLDKNLQPVAVGIPGELYIGGDGLARGYLNRPDFTAQRFVPNPWGKTPGARLYRTGDLVRWRSDGNLDFLGRLDYQVKIRGFRIELGEVESVIEQHPEVLQAVVGVHDAGEDKRLLAHYVGSASIDSLRSYLKQWLPEYMVPSWLIQLDAMPLTPNGKVDRKQLPPPSGDRPESEKVYAAPRNNTEEFLADLWADLLRVKQVGIHDNFFALGGHSLLGTRLMSRLRELLYIEVPVKVLFEASTIAEFSQALTRFEAKPGQTEKIAAILKQVQAMQA